MVPPGPYSYTGGGERAISLATGFFTGEYRRNSPRRHPKVKSRHYSDLRWPARHFKRGRAGTVQPLLESLTALGQARETDGGRFAA